MKEKKKGKKNIVTEKLKSLKSWVVKDVHRREANGIELPEVVF